MADTPPPDPNFYIDKVLVKRDDKAKYPYN